ncbi:type II secretion system F family protein [Campylobacter sp.]|uniref:type II secretion system F family protein n=1 Tax=Campylobacter sp. TaxID=205 RepID=UPI002AA952F8|nr:type II secretion system F family protein [Campylobacter sp.]MCI6660983.1 type II secretion system F family protein [Campylobacter sp.]
MKTYKVTQKKLGRVLSDTISAQNIAQAKQIAVNKRGGIVIEVRESKDIFDPNVIKTLLFTPKIKMLSYISTLRQLAVMTDAGISIHDSINEVVNNTKDKRVAQIFGRVRDDLDAGMNISESIVQFERDVGNVSIALISLGEQTGRLAESLNHLVEILQDVYDNRQKFKKAIRYPVVVVCAIILAFILLMVLVVPKFRDVFASFNAELPLPTRILLNIEWAFSNYGFAIGAGVLVAILITILVYHRNQGFKYSFDKYILKLYLIGNIIFFSTMSRFNLVFGELVRSGVPVIDALNTSLLNVENSFLRERLESVKISVSRGNSLSSSVAATELYENMLVQMIAAGERSGSIDARLGRITAYYKDRVNNILDNISAYIEPILLVFIAGMVILMALGIFMPMRDLAKAVK